MTAVLCLRVRVYGSLWCTLRTCAAAPAALSPDATPERTATAVAGIQEIASAFGVALQLKGSSRMLRNTFVQYLIMVAEILRVLKYI
jgi:uncharacterized membrane protein